MVLVKFISSQKMKRDNSSILKQKSSYMLNKDIHYTVEDRLWFGSSFHDLTKNSKKRPTEIMKDNKRQLKTQKEKFCYSPKCTKSCY